jgi:hypothetical protein
LGMNEKFYTGYIHSNGNNKAPVIEWLDWQENRPPSETEANKCKARGQKYKDGSIRVSKFEVSGIKNNPDPANQIHLICSNAKAPANDHLEPAISAYAMSDVFAIQEILRRMFN